MTKRAVTSAVRVVAPSPRLRGHVDGVDHRWHRDVLDLPAAEVDLLEIDLAIAVGPEGADLVLQITDGRPLRLLVSQCRCTARFRRPYHPTGGKENGQQRGRYSLVWRSWRKSNNTAYPARLPIPFGSSRAGVAKTDRPPLFDECTRSRFRLAKEAPLG